jgi:hypothetical protein
VQLLVALPHIIPLQVTATGSGSHPHAPPALQVSPPSQPPQLTGCWQSFIDDPQRFTHQFGSDEQQVLLVKQTPPSPQLDSAHLVFWPQLSVTWTPHLPAQAVTSSGVQHVSVAVRHMSVDMSQPVPPEEPHATIWPQLFMTCPHVRPWQVVMGGSATQLHELSTHNVPPSQLPHVMGWPQLSTVFPQRFSQ